MGQMKEYQEHELDESLAYMREQFRPLTQSIPIPSSLQADVLRRRLEQMEEQPPVGKIVSFPWKKVMGVAACLVVAVGSYFMLDGVQKTTPMAAASQAAVAEDAPMGAPVAGLEPQAMEAAEEEGLAIPDAALFAAPSPAAYSSGGELVGNDSATPKMVRGGAVEEVVLTLEEAQQTERYGEYLPQALPAGIASAEVYQHDEMMSAILTGESRGLICQIYPMQELQKSYLADSTDPKTWDLSLYPIPWSESMPEEYWWVASETLFKVEELSPAMVRARITTIGETSETMAQFGVLYGDMVVHYQFTNFDADEIYQLIETTKIAA